MSRELKILNLINEECEKHGISKEKALGKSRKRPIPEVKQAIIKRLREELELTYQDIGRWMGLDYTTVMHHYQIAANGISNQELNRAIKHINREEYNKFVTFTYPGSFKYAKKYAK